MRLRHTIKDISKAGVEYKKEDDLTWIGLKQKDYPTSTAWTWTDGTPLDYQNWGPSQPDDKRGREHCAQTHSDYLGRIPAKDNNYQRWDDCQCTLTMRAYVCKVPAYH
ncbi:lectin C-type domain protein [Necator americanus]|uniref:Lectin C-type domain protein n=1 Tax=Necator americanus TaxID=51031 RepID=W2TD77_NECAM|nr:lectin C-type domain protein [Necator americanus]ETN79763.1 lectin C-type domain protein [Necator americanus]